MGLIFIHKPKYNQNKGKVTIWNMLKKSNLNLNHRSQIYIHKPKLNLNKGNVNMWNMLNI